MSDKSILRIFKEIQQIEGSPDHQFYLAYDENDVTHVQTLMIGPPGTPYAFGMFNFSFFFPEQYPSCPPEVICQTTNTKTTRFNPNIYSSGKVCISLLGTWTGGSNEQWSSAHGILSLLISIQSLMCEKPFHNEPGFEFDRSGNSSDLIFAYNRKIIHETLRISVCDRLENYYAPNPCLSHCPFEDTCKYLFACYFYRYLDIIDTESNHVSPRQSFVIMPFESSNNHMGGLFNYPSLRFRMESFYSKYKDETNQWKSLSNSTWTDAMCPTFGHLMNQLNQIKQSKEFDGTLEINIKDRNPFIWYITTFGRPATAYEAGIFHIEMVFHSSFPEKRPRVRFITPFFHPNVSEDGIIYYRVPRMDDIKSHLSMILSLFTKDPNSDPATHVNKTASTLFFGNKDQKREYSRHARRCASNSLE